MSSSSLSKAKYDKKKNPQDRVCDSNSSYISHSHASSKPVPDLHKKYSSVVNCEKNDLEKFTVIPGKLVERKSTSVLVKKKKPVEVLVMKNYGQKKSSIKSLKHNLQIQNKEPILISSDTKDYDKSPREVEINKKQRGQPLCKKLKVISASSEFEEWTDSSCKNEKKDSGKKFSHSVKKTPSLEKAQSQNPIVHANVSVHSPNSISSSVYSDSSDIESRQTMSTPAKSPPKLDIKGVNGYDRKKNYALRKLFRKHCEGEAKSCGGIIINNNEAIRNVKKRVDYPINPPVTPLVPKEHKNTKKLSTLCKIPLSKLHPNLIDKLAKSEELRSIDWSWQVEKQKRRHNHHKRNVIQIASRSKKSKYYDPLANPVLVTQPPLSKHFSDAYSKDMMNDVNVWHNPTSVNSVIPEAKFKPLSKSLKHR